MIFFLFIFCKRLHKSFFCSSSTLSQFPGRTRVIGSNVGQISVSIPLLPCVNALSSENKASLHKLLDGGWFFVVVFFSPLPIFVGGYRNLVCSCRFFSSVSGIGVGQSESERKGEQNESTCEKNCLCNLIFFKKTNAWASREGPVALCECERKKHVRVCSQ